jgi:5-methylcytosine-specific restriction protein A
MPHKPPSHVPPGSAAARLILQREIDRARRDAPHRRLYSTERWQRFRLYILRERPLCEDCGLNATRDVHHVRGLEAHPEDLCDEDQVRGLCHPCHSVRTRRGE